MQFSRLIFATIFISILPIHLVAQSGGEGEMDSQKETQYHKESGYVNNTSINILVGRGQPSVRFQTVNGYRLTSKLSAGLGVGVVLYRDPLNLIPIFVDLKYKLLETNTIPFVFLKSGSSISFLSDSDTQVDKHDGGFMLNPGIGLQFEPETGVGIFITAGYNFDKSSFEQEGLFGQTVETEISHRRFQFGFGLSF